jgi:hypothetical protein
MAQVTLQDLINRALQRTDMVNNAGTSNFATTAELTYLANAAHARLYDMLVTTYEDFYQSTITWSLVANKEYYDLVADLNMVDGSGNPTFYKVLEIFLTNGSAGSGLSRFKVRRFNTNELSMLNNTVLTPTFTVLPTLYWRLEGTRLYLEPIPGSVGSYNMEMWYVPQCSKLVNLSDTIDYNTVYGWEEFIVNEMAINLKIKEDGDVTALMARQADFERRVKAAASNRDTSEALRVVDVERQYGYPWGQYI